MSLKDRITASVNASWDRRDEVEAAAQAKRNEELRLRQEKVLGLREFARPIVAERLERLPEALSVAIHNRSDEVPVYIFASGVEQEWKDAVWEELVAQCNPLGLIVNPQIRGFTVYVRVPDRYFRRSNTRLVGDDHEP